MLPKERVYVTLDHREPDRVPWGEHAIDYNVYEDILGRPTFFRAKFKETKAWWDGRRDEIVASHKRDIVDLARALELDLVVAPRLPDPDDIEPMKQLDDETYEDEKGSIFKISSTMHSLMPYWINPATYEMPTMEELEAEIADLDRGKVDMGPDSRWEVTRHVVKELGETHFVCSFTRDVPWPTFGASAEDQWLNMVAEPELAAKLSERNGKRAIAELRYFATQGLDGVIPPGDYAWNNGPLASPALFWKLVFPWLNAYCEEAHRLGLKVLKHACGNNWALMDAFVASGYDAYEGIQASASMDIKLLKERYGSQITLWGGVLTENIVGRGPRNVLDDAAYALNWAAPGGGFILGASHSLAVGAPKANILAMKQARDEWGVYPIRVPARAVPEVVTW